MLIVVAIIAILIAVSIPLVSSSLEKARKAVDDANMRSAVALGNIYYLTDETANFSGSGVTKYYSIDTDNKDGSLVADAPTTGYGKAKGNEGNILKVEIKDPPDTDATAVTVSWVAAGSSSGTGSGSSGD